MRPLLLSIALATAAPAAAAEPVTVPPALTDPATMDRLSDVMQALSQALLELPVGELRAAAEGREPTAQERELKVRDVAGISEAELQRQLAEARPAMQAAMQALAKSLPKMMEGMAEAREELERAAANMPRPDYPKR